MHLCTRALAIGATLVIGWMAFSEAADARGMTGRPGMGRAAFHPMPRFSARAVSRHATQPAVRRIFRPAAISSVWPVRPNIARLYPRPSVLPLAPNLKAANPVIPSGYVPPPAADNRPAGRCTFYQQSQHPMCNPSRPMPGSQSFPAPNVSVASIRPFVPQPSLGGNPVGPAPTTRVHDLCPGCCRKLPGTERVEYVAGSSLAVTCRDEVCRPVCAPGGFCARETITRTCDLPPPLQAYPRPIPGAGLNVPGLGSPATVPSPNPPGSTAGMAVQNSASFSRRVRNADF